ncbi:MAG: LysR family transcriptional regulator [Geminicoccaceae bacterium]|nr:LysR family transcriptional regulator [Geminicoccaceae bacterium]
MEIRIIDYFLTVAESGSLRAAAKALGLTQPALTKSIRRLEDETGVELFERRARGVTLTEYGRSFLRHARALKASMSEARSEIEALKRGDAGQVRIGAGPSWQTRILPDVLPHFRQHNPGVRIRVMGGHDDALKADLRRGALDLVVAALPEPSDDPDLDTRTLMLDHYRVIADRNHPLHHTDRLEFGRLLDFPWILPARSTYLARRLEVMMRAKGLAPPRAVIETDIVALKLNLMRGSDYLSFHAVGHLEAVAECDIRPLPFPEAGWQRRAGLIMRHGIEPNAATHALIETIESVCRAASSPDSIQVSDLFDGSSNEPTTMSRRH